MCSCAHVVMWSCAKTEERREKTDIIVIAAYLSLAGTIWMPVAPDAVSECDHAAAGQDCEGSAPYMHRSGLCELGSSKCKPNSSSKVGTPLGFAYLSSWLILHCIHDGKVMKGASMSKCYVFHG